MDSRKFWLARLAFLLLPVSVSLADDSPAGTTESVTPQVLYMHTEFLPYQVTAEKDIPYRFGREMVRQAFLLAAREELGVVVLDETLGEVPPSDGEVVHLILSERANLGGKWSLKLYRYAEGNDWREGDPVWEKTYKYKPWGTQMYREMVPKLEADSRGEFVSALVDAGLRSVDRGEQEDVAEDAEQTEELLLSVDFFSQYGAVRATHQEIARRGETPERLGRLARGYAHLSLLTMHHWNASSEAFAGRAMAYAQRMVAKSGETSLALHHRAYVWAITGSMHFALDDLKLIKKLTTDAEEGSQEFPSWTRLTKPYARCNRDALKKLSQEEESLKAWAQHLDFQVALAYRYPAWTFEAAREAAQTSPAAFNVYSYLAQHGGTLRARRIGANYAPHYFGQQITPCLDRIVDLPQSVRGVLPLDMVRQGLQGVVVKDPNPRDAFSALPSYIIRELRKEADQGPPPGLSWSALASLIEEEQFVGAAIYFKESTNATERSLIEEVDGVLPLIKGHRYAGYVEAFRYNLRNETEKVQAVLHDFELRDVRPSMAVAMNHYSNVKNGEGIALGPAAWRLASRNFTMNGMLEYCYPGANTSWTNFAGKSGAMLAREVSKVAPHLEVGMRMTIQNATKPKEKQLSEWQEKVKVDPDALAMVARHYLERKQYENAVECYQRSLAILPTVQNTMRLAEIHRWQKDFAKWEQVLLDYLKTENQGLEHSLIQEALATGLCERGEWVKAKPYAVAAGQTYSARGLSVASYVCEGLGHWQESERWIRSRTESYPSSSGLSWYLWCCRTGRGDQEAALKFAEPYVARLATSNSEERQVDVGVFYLLQGDPERARDAFAKALKIKFSYPVAIMLVQLSVALEDTETFDRTLVLIDQAAEAYKQLPGYKEAPHATMRAIVELIKAEEASPERMADIEAKLLAFHNSRSRTACCYFVATELSARGHEEEAVKYWRRALNPYDRDIDYATLAGFELATRYGTSRPEEDMLDKSTQWPPLDEE